MKRLMMQGTIVLFYFRSDLGWTDVWLVSMR